MGSWKQESGVNRVAWAEDVSLGVIGIWMVFKAMSLHEFLKGMSVAQKKEQSRLSPKVSRVRRSVDKRS